MKFGSMVVFMLKWLVASIPAALIALVVLTVAGGAISGVLMAFLSGIKSGG